MQLGLSAVVCLKSALSRLRSSLFLSLFSPAPSSTPFSLFLPSSHLSPFFFVFISCDCFFFLVCFRFWPLSWILLFCLRLSFHLLASSSSYAPCLCALCLFFWLGRPSYFSAFHVFPRSLRQLLCVVKLRSPLHGHVLISTAVVPFLLYAFYHLRRRRGVSPCFSAELFRGFFGFLCDFVVEALRTCLLG